MTAGLPVPYPDEYVQPLVPAGVPEVVVPAVPYVVVPGAIEVVVPGAPYVAVPGAIEVVVPGAPYVAMPRVPYEVTGIPETLLVIPLPPI